MFRLRRSMGGPSAAKSANAPSQLPAFHFLKHLGQRVRHFDAGACALLARRQCTRARFGCGVAAQLFDSLKNPFLAIVQTSRLEQVSRSGPVIPALAASCALPGMARPVVLEGRVLIDGGYVNPVPYDVVMDRADITVAVDVTGDPQRRPGARVPGTVEAVTGATQLLFHSITREKLKSIAPDIFIRPKVGAYSALDDFQDQRDPGRCTRRKG